MAGYTLDKLFMDICNGTESMVIQELGHTFKNSSGYETLQCF